MFLGVGRPKKTIKIVFFSSPALALTHASYDCPKKYDFVLEACDCSQNPPSSLENIGGPKNDVNWCSSPGSTTLLRGEDAPGRSTWESSWALSSQGLPTSCPRPWRDLDLEAEIRRCNVTLGMVWVPEQGLTLGSEAGFASGTFLRTTSKTFSADTSILKEVLGVLRHKVAREGGAPSPILQSFWNIRSTLGPAGQVPKFRP